MYYLFTIWRGWGNISIESSKYHVCKHSPFCRPVMLCRQQKKRETVFAIPWREMIGIGIRTKKNSFPVSFIFSPQDKYFTWVSSKSAERCFLESFDKQINADKWAHSTKPEARCLIGIFNLTYLFSGFYCWPKLLLWKRELFMDSGQKRQLWLGQAQRKDTKYGDWA